MTFIYMTSSNCMVARWAAVGGPLLLPRESDLGRGTLQEKGGETERPLHLIAICKKKNHSGMPGHSVKKTVFR